MSIVGPGVIEIRIHTTQEYRVFYVAKFAEAVYVLHAFTKQTQKTPQHDIDLAQRRYAELVRTRSKHQEKYMVMRVRRSSGNVFRDLGFSDDEAENLHVRADLMIRLSKLIEERGLTQAQAAKLLDVTQPRISDLMRGKIQLFSVDSLIEMLGHAGAQVSFVVKQRRQVA